MNMEIEDLSHLTFCRLHQSEELVFWFLCFAAYMGTSNLWASWRGWESSKNTSSFWPLPWLPIRPLVVVGSIFSSRFKDQRKVSFVERLQQTIRDQWQCNEFSTPCWITLTLYNILRKFWFEKMRIFYLKKTIFLCLAPTYIATWLSDLSEEKKN